MRTQSLPHRRPPTEYDERPCSAALYHVRGMPFGWSLNPYVGCAHRCTFCYVRAFEQRADRPSDDRYGRAVRVKVNLVTVLRRELNRPSWKRESVCIGSATDPYQPAEGVYRLTRGSLQALAEKRTPANIITRGSLVIRDIDVLSELARKAGVSVMFSIPTLRPDVVRTTEPGTPPPRQRLRALSKLAAAGISAGVAMAPILPGLSDDVASLREVVKAARDSGAMFIWGGPVRLMPGTRQHFLSALQADWPAMVGLYDKLYVGERRSLPYAASKEISQRVRAARALYPLRKQRVIAVEPYRMAEQMDLLLADTGPLHSLVD